MSKNEFGAADTNRLIELYEERRLVLQGTDKKSSAESRRREAWKSITDTINAESGKNFTVDAVKKRWQNKKSDAKMKHQQAKKERSITGGGEPIVPIELSESDQAIVNLEAGTAAFDGVPGGIETPAVSEVVCSDGDVASYVECTSLSSSAACAYPTGLKRVVAASPLGDENRSPSAKKRKVTSGATKAQDLLNLQHEVLQAQLANQLKFSAVLDKAETFLDKANRSPWLNSNPDVSNDEIAARCGGQVSFLTDLFN